MIKQIALMAYENKIVAVIVAFGGSSALSEFLVSYDLTHSIFGFAGFCTAAALAASRDKENAEDKEKTAIQWLGFLALSLILPVFFTNGLHSIAVKIIPVLDDIIVAFIIGMIPDIIIALVTKYITKKAS